MSTSSHFFFYRYCVVTHLVGALYILGASQLAGFAAVKAENHTRRAFELFGDGAGYAFLPLAGESFGRLGRGGPLPL